MDFASFSCAGCRGGPNPGGNSESCPKLTYHGRRTHHGCSQRVLGRHRCMFYIGPSRRLFRNGSQKLTSESMGSQRSTVSILPTPRLSPHLVLGIRTRRGMVRTIVPPLRCVGMGYGSDSSLRWTGHGHGYQIFG